MMKRKDFFPHKEPEQYSTVTHYEKDEHDNIYFNIEIRSSNDTFGEEAFYDVQRDIPLIHDASQYYASIVRFNVPNFDVPIHVMPIQPNQGDPNLSEYSITLEFNGDVVQEFLIFVPTADFTEPPPPNANPNGLQTVSPYYFIFEYSSMITIINTAFALAFSKLAAPPPGSAAPVILYNSVTTLFTILAQKDFYDVKLATPIFVYFSGQLWTILNGFANIQVNVSIGGSTNINQFSPDGRDEQLQITDYFDNTNLPQFSPPFAGDDFYNLTQQYATIFNWNPFKRIVFVTNSLPINGEYIKGSGSSTIKVLTDFSPFLTHEVRTVWQYVPDGQYRLVDMTSHEKIDTIDLQIYWIDRFDNFNRVIIPWGQQATIKLAFLNKKLYKNYVSRELRDSKEKRYY